MGTTTLYLRDTQTETGTTGTPSALGSSVDMSRTIGDTGTLGSGGTASGTYVVGKKFLFNVGVAQTGTSFPVSVRMDALAANTGWRFKIERLNSAGVVQATSDLSSDYVAAGVEISTLTLNTTWVAGDILALTIDIKRTSGGGTSTFTVAVGDADSYIQADLEPNLVYLGVWEEANKVGIRYPSEYTHATVEEIVRATAPSFPPEDAETWSLHEYLAQSGPGYILLRRTDTEIRQSAAGPESDRTHDWQAGVVE